MFFLLLKNIITKTQIFYFRWQSYLVPFQHHLIFLELQFRIIYWFEIKKKILIERFFIINWKFFLYKKRLTNVLFFNFNKNFNL